MCVVAMAFAACNDKDKTYELKGNEKVMDIMPEP